MSTNIEWTDVTDNIIAVKGGGWWCRKISPGCANCYAAKMNQNAFYGGNKLAYSGPLPDLILRESIIDSWQRQRVPKKHFVASMTDVFGDWVPQEWVNKMLIGMVLAPKQVFQILTKRPDVAAERISEFLKLAGAADLPPNVWIGTSVENQACANQRIPHLLSIPAKVRFLSCEPLLGPVSLDKLSRESNGSVFLDNALTGWRSHGAGGWTDSERIHWVIAGGESGSKARPMHPDWVRSLLDQCQAAGVPFLFKQWGEWAPASNDEMPKFIGVDGEFSDSPLQRLGKKNTGRIIDGREWNEFPNTEVTAA